MDKILVKNGNTYDPVSKVKAKKDLALQDGIIVSPAGFAPDHVIDAAGCLVIPGLIDSHVHCMATESGVAPDIFGLPNGVTACVDAGSTGVSSFESASGYHLPFGCDG